MPTAKEIESKTELHITKLETCYFKHRWQMWGYLRTDPGSAQWGSDGGNARGVSTGIT